MSELGGSNHRRTVDNWRAEMIPDDKLLGPCLSKPALFIDFDTPVSTRLQQRAARSSREIFIWSAAAMAERAQQTLQNNFLRQFRDENSHQFAQFSAIQFMEVWKHYDEDENGYIEGHELDSFLREFVASVHPDNDAEVISEAMLERIRKLFMDAFDENEDNRIDIRELALILPTEENFLLLFHRNNPLDSSVEFMKTWREFDRDCSGYIEADELKAFLGHLLKEAQKDVTEEVLLEYTDTMLNLFDRNKDGKLQLSEMAKLIPIKENYLCRPIFRNMGRITKLDIEKVFRLYDKDENGTMENEELNGFLKDLMDLIQDDYDSDDIAYMRRAILQKWDVNHDGKINLAELSMILRQQLRMLTEDSIESM